MPMTALDIYKVLPQTNCGDCGVPTCLAFAMQLATKKAGIDDCPYATDEAKAALAGAEAPPMAMDSRVMGTPWSAQRNMQRTFSGVK